MAVFEAKGLLLADKCMALSIEPPQLPEGACPACRGAGDDAFQGNLQASTEPDY